MDGLKRGGDGSRRAVGARALAQYLLSFIGLEPTVWYLGGGTWFRGLGRRAGVWVVSMEQGFEKWPQADRSMTMNHRVSVQTRSRPSEPLERANCRFCRALTGGANGIWTDVPIYETDGFVVTPSLGALVEGWLLVLPREHAVNTSRIAANLRQEFTAIVDRTVAIVADEFGPVTLFEHGPSYDGSRLGCGVDHAHLLVVPLPFDL